MIDRFKKFEDGQALYGPTGHVCVLQVPDAATREEAERTARAVLGTLEGLRLVPGHVGFEKAERPWDWLVFVPRGYMVFVSKDHPQIDFLTA